jgi:hypothetical protein
MTDQPKKPNGAKLLVVFGVVLVLSLIVRSIIPTGEEMRGDERADASSADAATSQQAHVSSAEFGEAWPFTVAEGELACDGISITMTAGGKTYAVNGMAKMEKKWMDIDEIVKDDPASPGRKRDIETIVERGQALCRK